MKPWTSHLVVHQYVHNVVVYFRGDASFGFVGQQDELDPQQRNQDERGSDRLHVQTGLGLVRHLQLGDQNPDDVQQKEQVHLQDQPKHRNTQAAAR